METADQGLGRRPQPLQHRVRGKDLANVNRSLTQSSVHTRGRRSLQA
jgi:hypothetical protein